MRTVFLTNDQGSQVALAHKLAAATDLAGIVFSRNVPRRGPSVGKRARLAINRVAGRTVGRELVRVWLELQGKYRSSYAQPPVSDITQVTNVNDTATLEAIERLRPDLVVVSGTNLVGRKVIEAAQRGRGIVNLHTGISPYVRGGPNCTNWCLAKNWFHFIGNTVMWLDLGIDTGNLIATEQTPLDGSESLPELHWKVMQHAHDLYIASIKRIAAGGEVPSVPQNTIGDGAHFNSVDWNAWQMSRALRNFYTNYGPYFTKGRPTAAAPKVFPILDA